MADGGHIPKRGIISIAADIFKCSDRYARMYITIAERAISSVLNAVITPASNKRIKNNHITVKCAAQIASLPLEQQEAALVAAQHPERDITANTRTAVKSWLLSLQAQIDAGVPLNDNDQHLLAQIQKLHT